MHLPYDALYKPYSHIAPSFKNHLQANPFFRRETDFTKVTVPISHLSLPPNLVDKITALNS